jgi:YVTN family beta-propeller protein
MRRFRRVLVVVVLVSAGALVGVVPDGVSAVAGRAPCRATAVVTGFPVSTVDVRTRTKDPADIEGVSVGGGVAVTPDGKTALVTIPNGVSTIDVKTRTKRPTGIPVGSLPWGIAVTPDGKTAFVTNAGSGTVSTIDVKTRTKHPDDIAVGTAPFGVAVTPDGKTAFVTNNGSGTVSAIDVKTRTKHPADIAVGAYPKGVAITSDGKTAFVTNANLIVEPVEPGGNSVSTIDVKTRKKHPDDITVGLQPLRVAVTPCRR